MKILQVSSVLETVPPAHYGGVERIVSALCTYLPKFGHEVTLMAPFGSQTNIDLIPTSGKNEFSGTLSPEFIEKKIEAESNVVKKVLEIGSNYDIIHSHVPPEVGDFYKLIEKFNDRLVFTLHGDLSWFNDDLNKHVYEMYQDNDFLKKAHFISISNSQRKPAPGLNYLGTVYNGTDLSEYKFDLNPLDNNMIFVGRTTPDKGIDLAIGVSQRLNRSLLMMAKIDPIVFYEEIVKPSVDGKLIKFFDAKMGQNPKNYFGRSRLSILPIRWEEPFGLVLIESMACGTPVVAFANGSMPEIVQDGVTGFIVNESVEKKKGDWVIKKTGLEGLCEAVERIYEMNEKDYNRMRLNCRTHVEKNFTYQQMVENYEKMYNLLIKPHE